MIDELLLASPNIRLSAKGTMDFHGKLDLGSRLAINDRIRDQLFGGMRESFRQSDEPGYAAVDFQVTGTLARPKTNLMGKLVGRDLKDLGGIINGLLGGKKTDRAKTKKVPNESPMATPATEPAAPVEPLSPPEQASPGSSPSESPAATSTP
jgi:hypothetical protein